MKVIFLDIDGVLNSRKYDKTRDYSKQTDIDETRVPLVKEIADATDAKIVLSSTWRYHWNADGSLCDEDGRYINEIFAKFGLTIYDKTPDLGIMASRREEIKEWLDTTDETIDSFVIIDDYMFDWGEFAKRFVRTEPQFRAGLEKDHVIKAIEILNVSV